MESGTWDEHCLVEKKVWKYQLIHVLLIHVKIFGLIERVSWTDCMCLFSTAPKSPGWSVQCHLETLLTLGEGKGWWGLFNSLNSCHHDPRWINEIYVYFNCLYLIADRFLSPDTKTQGRDYRFVCWLGDSSVKPSTFHSKSMSVIGWRGHVLSLVRSKGHHK